MINTNFGEGYSLEDIHQWAAQFHVPIHFSSTVMVYLVYLADLSAPCTKKRKGLINFDMRSEILIHKSLSLVRFLQTFDKKRRPLDSAKN